MKPSGTDGSIFSKRLQELMKKNGTTQETLADYMKIKRQTISLYQNGKTKPNSEKIVQIAKYFEVTSDYLLGLTPDSIPIKQFSDDEKAFMRLLVDAGYKWLARVGGCLYIYKKRLNEQDDNWFIDFGFQHIPQELFPQIMQGDEPINMNEVI
jgi:transcriptional regulator with XRE-family HTH domain